MPLPRRLAPPPPARRTVGSAALAVALALAGAASGGAAPAAAQSAEGVLSPGGRLRFELAPEFHHWAHRFGLREEDGGLVEESEPLGFDLERDGLFDVESLRAGLRAALGDPTLDLTPGSARALIARDRTRVSFGAALGLFDWLTLRVSVPIVRARTEILFDYRPGAGDLGRSPALLGDGRVAAFLGDLDLGLGQLQARMDQECPDGPGCADLAALLDDYSAFAEGMEAAYAASPLFVAEGSAAAAALEARVAALRAAAATGAPGVVVPDAVPLAATPLDRQAIAAILTGSGYGLVRPLATDPGLWVLGDIEVSAAFRLVDGALRDSASAPVRFRYQLGGRALVRLPTGTPDDPDVPLDFAGSDGQMDIEAGVFADLHWSRLGVRAEASRGVQRPVDLVRRVVRPEVVFAPLATRSLVRWTPADYTEIEVSPRWHLTDELAVGAFWRVFDKGEDRYRAAGAPEGSPSAAVLQRETGGSLHEAGLGLAFSTLATWREGRARLPFEVRFAVRKAVAGGGGRVPDGLRLEGTGRVFWRLWGAEPEPAP